MNTLESIADKLLSGKITPQVANKLCDMFTNCNSKNYLDRENYVHKKAEPQENTYKREIKKCEGRLEIVDEMGQCQAYINYSIEAGDEGDSLFLESLKSFEQDQGHFRRLFNKLVSLGNEKRLSHMNLEVELSNRHARRIYEHMGFYRLEELGFDDFCGTAMMRYDFD